MRLRERRGKCNIFDRPMQKIRHCPNIGVTKTVFSLHVSARGDHGHQNSIRRVHVLSLLKLVCFRNMHVWDRKEGHVLVHIFDIFGQKHACLHSWALNWLDPFINRKTEVIFTLNRRFKLSKKVTATYVNR